MMIIRRLILVLMAGLLAACGMQSTPTIQPTIEPTPTDEPEATAENDQETVTGNESPGEVLFRQFYEEVGFACKTCHYPDSDNRLLGPGLLHVEERFETYDVDVDNVEDYIKQSILNPAVFIVPADSPYPENIMPRNYSAVFSEADLDALVDYILSF